VYLSDWMSFSREPAGDEYSDALPGGNCHSVCLQFDMMYVLVSKLSFKLSGAAPLKGNLKPGR
jgi:hypothetical protein